MAPTRGGREQALERGEPAARGRRRAETAHHGVRSGTPPGSRPWGTAPPCRPAAAPGGCGWSGRRPPPRWRCGSGSGWAGWTRAAGAAAGRGRCVFAGAAGPPALGSGGGSYRHPSRTRSRSRLVPNAVAGVGAVRGVVAVGRPGRRRPGRAARGSCHRRTTPGQFPPGHPGCRRSWRGSSGAPSGLWGVTPRPFSPGSRSPGLSWKGQDGLRPVVRADEGQVELTGIEGGDEPGGPRGTRKVISPLPGPAARWRWCRRPRR